MEGFFSNGASEHQVGVSEEFQAHIDRTTKTLGELRNGFGNTKMSAFYSNLLNDLLNAKRLIEKGELDERTAWDAIKIAYNI